MESGKLSFGDTAFVCVKERAGREGREGRRLGRYSSLFFFQFLTNLCFCFVLFFWFVSNLRDAKRETSLRLLANWVERAEERAKREVDFYFILSGAKHIHTAYGCVAVKLGGEHCQNYFPFCPES